MAKNRDELIADVHSRTHIWDAQDQGRLAYHDGISFDQNPWRLYKGYSHINVSDWDRGWQQEAAPV